MEPDELIVAVFLPTPAGRTGAGPASTAAASAVGGKGDDAGSSPRPFEFVRPFKQVYRMYVYIYMHPHKYRVRSNMYMEMENLVVKDVDLLR